MSEASQDPFVQELALAVVNLASAVQDIFLALVSSQNKDTATMLAQLEAAQVAMEAVSASVAELAGISNDNPTP
jgi:hypothetical protein